MKNIKPERSSLVVGVLGIVIFFGAILFVQSLVEIERLRQQVVRAPTVCPAAPAPPPEDLVLNDWNDDSIRLSVSTYRSTPYLHIRITASYGLVTLAPADVEKLKVFLAQFPAQAGEEP